MSFLKYNTYGENYEKLLKCNAGCVVQAVWLVFSLCYFSHNKAPVHGSVVLVGILQNLVAYGLLRFFSDLIKNF